MEVIMARVDVLVELAAKAMTPSLAALVTTTCRAATTRAIPTSSPKVTAKTASMTGHAVQPKLTHSFSMVPKPKMLSSDV